MAACALARLALIAPALLPGVGQLRDPAGSWRKWRAILRWSLGLEAVSAPSSPAAAQPAG